jgi:hypothetical protein
MSEKRPIDWESIERDYRAGVLSVREIAAANGITHGAINKRAKRDQWDRDLTARIQAKADALVSKALVSTSVSNERLATDREIVEANATRIAQVRSDHRRDIGDSRQLAQSLMLELKHQTQNGELYESLFELLSDPEGDAEDSTAAAKERQRRRREIFERALSLGGRVKTMKDLADVLKTLIGLEREAYGLAVAVDPTSKPAETDPIEGARRLAFALHRAGNLIP